MSTPRNKVVSVPSLVTVTYLATTYSRPRKGFKFPQKLKEAFGFKGKCKVALMITTISGETLFCGISKFISGPEITDAATVRHIDFDQDIIVIASRPPST